MATPSINSFYTPALQRSIASSLWRSPSHSTPLDTTHLLSQRQVSGSCLGRFMPKGIFIPSASSPFKLKHHVKLKHGHYHLLVTKSSSITTTNSNGEEGSSNSNEANTPSPDSEVNSKTSNSNNSATSSRSTESKLASSNSDPVLKRTPLTAREKLRAARVLSRYSETKNTSSSKPRMGSKLLDALRESEKGKKGLPEAPSNMLDDGKRGMPKKGLTFDFPGGNDLLVIVFSFVFISTVMFATTFFVWKVGAIHFNE